MQHVATLGHEEAQRAIEAIKAELLRRGKAAVIVVADAHGELIALLRLDGTPLPSILIATNKAWTAARARANRRARSASRSAIRRPGSIRPITATRATSAGAAACRW